MRGRDKSTRILLPYEEGQEQILKATGCDIIIALLIDKQQGLSQSFCHSNQKKLKAQVQFKFFPKSKGLSLFKKH